MTSATIIFPNQLFDPHPAMAKDRPVWLIEDSLFFGGDPHQPMRFHKHKLILHRASMKAYQAMLVSRGYDVTYVEHRPGSTIGDVLPDEDELWMADPVDYLLELRIRRWCRQRRAVLNLVDSPMFLTQRDWFMPWFDGRKRYYMADFYVAQRKRMNLLIERDGSPTGGHWSFDADNRKRWPAKRLPPPVFIPSTGSYVQEARQYVDLKFPANPGSSASFWFPVTHKDAEKSLHHFLEHRFQGFGDFEDAISTSHSVLHHSVLTPALNSGLLTPRQVIDHTLTHAKEHRIAINDLEGFIRQIIGWREFMRIVYVREGVRERTANFWGNERKLSAAWYEGSTGLVPVDHVIRRVLDHSYCHHIERLMVMGNAMLLCEIDPDEVYRWFMELFIDAYDWVMVPNVYGMSQYADGGLITTKPYISGSNYLKKMSDFQTGPWCEIWDGLYWRFIDNHRDFFSRNPRLSMMVRTLEKMDPARRTMLLQRAGQFLNQQL